MTPRDTAFVVPFLDKDRVKDNLDLLVTLEPGLGYRLMVFGADAVFVIYGPDTAQLSAAYWIIENVPGAKPW